MEIRLLAHWLLATKRDVIDKKALTNSYDTTGLMPKMDSGDIDCMNPCLSLVSATAGYFQAKLTTYQTVL